MSEAGDAMSGAAGTEGTGAERGAGNGAAHEAGAGTVSGAGDPVHTAQTAQRGSETGTEIVPGTDAGSERGAGGTGNGARKGSGGLAGDFLDAAIDLLHVVKEHEADNIAAAGALLADTITGGGRLFAFGAGHSSLPAQDTVYRAGGLAVMNLLPVPGVVGVDVRPATLGSALERVDGLADTVLRCSPARSGDVLIVISLSGRNALPVEMAMNARTRGLGVIGVTSVAYARHTAPRHSSGSFLKDHCDIVLDSHIAVGDAELTAEGLDAPFGPASTIVTSALMQAVVATATGELAARGVSTPLLRSGNVDGGPEWNEGVMARFADRIFYR